MSMLIVCACACSPFYQLELLCRIRVQVEARASMRRALRSGASCLRTLKLSAMPSYFRRALAAGQGDALDLGHSTFVVHLAVDWCAPPTHIRTMVSLTPLWQHASQGCLTLGPTSLYPLYHSASRRLGHFTPGPALVSHLLGVLASRELARTRGESTPFCCSTHSWCMYKTASTLVHTRSVL